MIQHRAFSSTPFLKTLNKQFLSEGDLCKLANEVPKNPGLQVRICFSTSEVLSWVNAQLDYVWQVFFRPHFKHLQRDVGMRRQHIDVILTQRKDDDRLAPINQVSSNLKDLSEREKVVHIYKQ